MKNKSKDLIYPDLLAPKGIISNATFGASILKSVNKSSKLIDDLEVFFKQLQLESDNESQLKENIAIFINSNADHFKIHLPQNSVTDALIFVKNDLKTFQSIAEQTLNAYNPNTFFKTLLIDQDETYWHHFCSQIYVNIISSGELISREIVRLDWFRKEWISRHRKYSFLASYEQIVKLIDLFTEDNNHYSFHYLPFYEGLSKVMEIFGIKTSIDPAGIDIEHKEAFMRLWFSIINILSFDESAIFIDDTVDDDTFNFITMQNFEIDSYYLRDAVPIQNFNGIEYLVMFCTDF